ncbi:hypothetical protein [Microvirga massiliensis]|uniref:hypothetical protein n=1 Tax=Microvirga massiliensis TaxID=1033741 RepID=UPI0011C9295C|nr:hypothetical protein [Microvirga massiliensis]
MPIDAVERPDPIALDNYEWAREELPAVARSMVEAAGREFQRIYLGIRAEPYVSFPFPWPFH